tara:strand:- start:3026 stop:3625 length:600 start_codon:yes stop_codon:yes gene_type:complete
MPPKQDKGRFPAARIKKLMQVDEDVGRIAAGVLPLVSKCLELFGAELLEKATAAMQRQGDSNVLQVAHIKEAVDSEQLFDFLQEFVANCPAEEHLPGAPREKKQKAAGDAPAAKRQKPAGGKGGSSSDGPSCSTADAVPFVEATAAGSSGEAAAGGAAPAMGGAAASAAAPLPLPASTDLFAGPSSAANDDDYDDYDAE